MSQASLEERVSALETLVCQLMTQANEPNSGKNWRQSLGMFPDDEGLKEIDVAGAAIREADRKRARRAVRNGKSSAKPKRSRRVSR